MHISIVMALRNNLNVIGRNVWTAVVITLRNTNPIVEQRLILASVFVSFEYLYLFWRKIIEMGGITFQCVRACVRVCMYCNS